MTTPGRERRKAALDARLRRKRARAERLLLYCDRHGSVAWRGTIVCEDCGLVFQMEEPTASRYAPETCPCGKRLVPERGQPKGGTFSGAPICRHCYEMAERHGGRVPSELMPPPGSREGFLALEAPPERAERSQAESAEREEPA